jgi:hypothetical protein
MNKKSNQCEQREASCMWKKAYEWKHKNQAQPMYGFVEA